MPKPAHAGQTIRKALAFGLLCAGSNALRASSQALPPAAPTTMTTPVVTNANRNSPAPVVPAEVAYSGGLLTVRAQNSSMNHILGEVSRLTGMKITGGIREERVFGTYGPGSAQDVLGQLLDGTGANVLLREDPNHKVRELVLSARLGGVTPPPPPGANESNGSEGNDEQVQPSERWRQLQARREAANARMQQQMQLQQNQQQQGQPQENGSFGTSPVQQPEQQQPQSPNGVRTPNQMDHPANPAPVFPGPGGSPPPN